MSADAAEPQARRRVLVAGLVCAVLVAAAWVATTRLVADDGDLGADRVHPQPSDVVRMMTESGIPVEGPPLIYFDFRPEAEGTPVTMSFASLDGGTVWLSITDEAALQRRDLELLRGFLNEDQIVTCGPATAGTDRVAHLDRIASVLHAAFGPCD